MSDLARVQLWAERLIEMHLSSEWTFAFDTAKRRAGLCNYTAKRISVSKYLAARHSDDDNHQTLLHEVAHAIAGPGAKHGPRWQRVARELGYIGGTTHRLETATELAPWVGTCPAGHTVFRHRRPARAASCKKCSRGFDPRFMFTWTRREITAADRRAAQSAR